jgi:uncharacterized protein YcbX
MSHSAHTVGSVVGLWRYPVKSMMGEELDATEVDVHGVLGDRAHALVDRSEEKRNARLRQLGPSQQGTATTGGLLREFTKPSSGRN